MHGKGIDAKRCHVYSVAGRLLGKTEVRRILFLFFLSSPLFPSSLFPLLPKSGERKERKKSYGLSSYGLSSYGLNKTKMLRQLVTTVVTSSGLEVTTLVIITFSYYN